MWPNCQIQDPEPFKPYWTLNEVAISSGRTYSQGFLPHGELNLGRDQDNIWQEGNEVDDQYCQDGQRCSAEEGTDEIAVERKHMVRKCLQLYHE